MYGLATETENGNPIIYLEIVPFRFHKKKTDKRKLQTKNGKPKTFNFPIFAPLKPKV